MFLGSAHFAVAAAAAAAVAAAAVRCTNLPLTLNQLKQQA